MGDIETAYLAEIKRLEIVLAEAKERNKRLALRVDKLNDRLNLLSFRLEAVEGVIAELAKARNRPIKVSLLNVCALDGERDSVECPDANVYRHQQGCRGVACVREYRDYYSDYRKRRGGSEADTV
jgi:hypothetical protein